jgi:N-acetyl-anhydromuramyl-L-alanine amidase AmpD
VPPPAARRHNPWRSSGNTPNANAGVQREWLPSPYARPRAWRWIVIHHSATPTGGAVAFDRMHRRKGWDELGYHFVIGNGTDTTDGRVEPGSRWLAQKHGAHTKTAGNEFNDFGIGVCLVGNFDATRPSAAQMASLAKLVAHLSRTYRVPPEHIIGHGTAKPTDCPGRYLSVAEVRRRSGMLLAADSADPGYTPAATASAELLSETPGGH